MERVQILAKEDQCSFWMVLISVNFEPSSCREHDESSFAPAMNCQKAGVCGFVILDAIIEKPLRSPVKIVINELACSHLRRFYDREPRSIVILVVISSERMPNPGKGSSRAGNTSPYDRALSERTRLEGIFCEICLSISWVVCVVTTNFCNK